MDWVGPDKFGGAWYTLRDKIRRPQPTARGCASEKIEKRWQAANVDEQEVERKHGARNYRKQETELGGNRWTAGGARQRRWDTTQGARTRIRRPLPTARGSALEKIVQAASFEKLVSKGKNRSKQEAQKRKQKQGARKQAERARAKASKLQEY